MGGKEKVVKNAVDEAKINGLPPFKILKASLIVAGTREILSNIRL